MNKPDPDIRDAAYRPKGLLGYVGRNRLWLTPMMVACYAVLLGWVLMRAPGPGPIPVSPWVWSALQVAGFFGAGVGARLTDTLSADVVQWLGLVLGLIAVIATAL